jgi:TPR repeat protein
MGNCYYEGRGTKLDYNKAFSWFKPAAEQGLPEAQYRLGNCYYNGEGVKQDY